MKSPINKRSWIDPRLVVSESPIGGKGIFTTAAIKKDEVIMVFGGEVVKRKSLDEEKYRWQTAFPIELDLFIALPNTDNQDTVDEFLNHSCNPSAWLIDEITVVARREIQKGEEITIDVATWDMDEEWLYSEDGKCYCKDPECRKVLTPHDYLKKSIQERYEGHFSPYIQRRIDEAVRYSHFKTR